MAASKKLNKRAIEALEPRDRLYSVADGEGLRIFVYPKDANGRERSKRWESKVYLHGREIRLALGTWPGVSLDRARELHAKYRAEAKAGRDPRELKKPAPEPEAEQTFEALFWDWFEARSPGWKEYHRYQTRNIGNLHVVPLFGSLVPAEVRPVDVKRIITPLMQEKPTTGHKVLGICSRVFRYAAALDLVPSDPCRDLRGVLPPRPKVNHRAALTDPAEIGELMWGIANFPFSSLVIRQALRFAALTAARPKEVVMASWKEIDLGAAVWIIPPERMKRGREHRVPLSRQALELLQARKAVAGGSPWVFPSPRARGRSISSNDNI